MKAIKPAGIIVLASLMLFLSACNLYGEPSSDTSGMVISYLPSSGAASAESTVSINMVSALPFDGSLRLNLSAGAEFIESVTWLGDNLLLIDSSSETVRDAFELYDFNSNTTTPIMLGISDEVRYSFRMAFGHYILFESEIRWTGDHTYVVDTAWIYDIDTKTAVKYTLKDYETKPKKGDILCSGLRNRVYYVNMTSGAINAVYYMPNSGYSTAVSPDKSQIAYANHDGVYVSAPDFSNANC